MITEVNNLVLANRRITLDDIHWLHEQSAFSLMDDNLCNRSKFFNCVKKVRGRIRNSDVLAKGANAQPTEPSCKSFGAGVHWGTFSRN